MPVTKTASGPTIITCAKTLNTLDGQVSGATRDADWSVTQRNDPSIQLQANLSAASPGALMVLTAPALSSGTVTYTLPSASGVLAAVGSEVVQYAVPSTGQTVTVDPSTSTLLVNPAGTLLALTIAFPAGVNGKYLTIACSQILTGLTLTGAGSDTILGALTAMAAVNGFASYVFNSTAGKWFRTG